MRAIVSIALLASSASAAELPRACADIVEHLNADLAHVTTQHISWSLDRVDNGVELSTTLVPGAGFTEEVRITIGSNRTGSDQAWRETNSVLNERQPRRVGGRNIATRSAERAIAVEHTVAVDPAADHEHRWPPGLVSLKHFEALLEPCATIKDTP